MSTKKRRVIGVQPKLLDGQSQLQLVRRDIKSAKSNRVPPLLLNGEIFQKFDSKKENDSSMVLTLRKQTNLGTPRSIQTFIAKNSTGSVQNDAAIVIQRNWRNYRFRMKTRYFLGFFRKLRLQKCGFAFANWKLGMGFPADKSIKYFKMYCHLNLLSGLHPPYSIRRHQMSFNGYMKTNLLQADNLYPEDKLVKIVVSLNKPLLLNCFRAWNDMATDTRMLKKASTSVYQLSKYRSQFGPMFWTYHVWKRWVQWMKAKKKGIRGKIPRSFYLPEWNFFMAKKNQQKRLNGDADLLFRRCLVRRTCISLHIHALENMKNTQSISDIQKRVNEVTMLKTYRAFLILISFRRMKVGLMTRTLRYWYKHVDQTRVNRLFLDVYRQRRVLSCLNDAFRKWRLNIIEEGAGVALVHEKVKENRTKLLRFAYLLSGDFIHYTQITAFHDWLKIIHMKKKALRFKTWSLNYSKKDSLKKFLFDCFRIKADKPVDRTNYSPFTLDTRQSVPKKKKLIDVFSKKKVSLDYYTNCVSAPRNAANHIDQYEFCEKGIEYWKSDDIKNFLIQIIYLLYKYTLNKPIDMQKRIKELKDFRIRNMLFNQNGVAEFRARQITEDYHLMKELKERNIRDNLLILKMERHEAAMAYHEIEPNFTVCPLDEEDAQIQRYKEKFLTKKKKKAKKKKDGFVTARSSSLSQSKKKKKKGKKKSKSPENKTQKSKEENNENEHNEEEDETKDEEEEIYKEMNKKLRYNYSAEALLKAKIRRHAIRPKNEIPVHPLLGPIQKLKDKTLENIRQYRRDPKMIFVDKVARRNINTRQLQASSSNLSLSRQSSTYESFIPIEPRGNLLKVQSIHEFKLPPIEGSDEDEVVDIFNSDEEIPTIQEEPSSLSDDGDLLQKTAPQTPIKLQQQNLKVSLSPDFLPKKINFGNITASPSPKKTPEKPVVKQKKPEAETTKAITNIQSNISADISLEDLEQNFMQDPGYVERDKNEEIGYLTNKYFTLLEILLGKKLRNPKFEIQNQKSPQNNLLQDHFPTLAFRISKIVHRLKPAPEPKHAPPKVPKPLSAGQQQLQERRERKLQRKSLYEMKDEHFETVQGLDGKKYKKSNCPEFANVYFEGDQVLTSAPWESRVEKPRSSASDLPSVALPSPTITVKGFENIPGFSALVQKIQNYIGNEEEEEVEEEEMFDENDQPIIVPKRLKMNFVELMNQIAQKYLKDEVERLQNPEISQFVDTSSVDLISSRTEKSTHSVKEETPRRQFIITKNKTSNHKAFSTEDRSTRPPHIMERKLTFTSEMLRAIKEGADIMRMHTDKISETEEKPEHQSKSLKALRNRIQEIRREINSQYESEAVTPKVSSRRKISVKKIKEIEVGQGEVALTIGGRSKRENMPSLMTQRSMKRPSTAGMTMRRTPKEDLTDVIVSSRPKTSRRSALSSGRKPAITPHPSNTSVNIPSPYSSTASILQTTVNDQTAPIFAATAATTARPRTAIVQKPYKQNQPQQQQQPPLTHRTQLIIQTPTPTSRTAPADYIPNLSIAGLDTSKMSVRVHEAYVGKRKPQFTKMTPTQPRAPETLVYDMPKPPKKPIRGSKDKKWKVGISRSEVVSDKDVDFLMFITPYIMSPDLLLKILNDKDDNDDIDTDYQSYTRDF